MIFNQFFKHIPSFLRIYDLRFFEINNLLTIIVKILRSNIDRQKLTFINLLHNCSWFHFWFHLVSLFLHLTLLSKLHLPFYIFLYPYLTQALERRCDWGRGIMAPLVLQLWGHQKPKTQPWHIFGTKNYLKSHFEHF